MGLPSLAISCTSSFWRPGSSIVSESPSMDMPGAIFPIDSRDTVSLPPSASTITSADLAVSMASCMSFSSVSDVGAL